MFQSIYQSVLQNEKNHQLVLIFVVILFYGNTLLNDFAVDDSIVIVKNEYVKKGFSGISDILGKDTFRGFFKTDGKDKLVSGGRYRPLSLVLFAIIYQFVGASPFIFHLLTILCFAGLCLLLYSVLKKLLSLKFKEEAPIIAFLSAVLFAMHPIHTECVANIKGLDEILALLLSFGSFWFALQWIDSKKMKDLLLSSMCLCLALFSKENSISYMLLIPLGIYLFLEKGFGNSFKIFLWLFAASFIFLICRAQILGWNPIAGHSIELMNNPFLKYINGRYFDFTPSEKLGTIFYTLIRYIGLLFFPHPLTYDYYPKHITLHSLSSPISLFAILIYVGLIFYAIKSFKNKPIISFSIIAFLIPLFIVSNLLFSVGVFMGERFLFMPSIGFCLLASYFLTQLMHNKKSLAVALLLICSLLFAFKTITRNEDWKDDYTLISHDIKISPNSAKINTAMGGITLEKLNTESDPKVLKSKIDLAKKHLNKAIEIHPLYFEAYNLLGNAHFMAKEYKEAISKFDFILKNKIVDTDAKSNLSLSYRELGRVTGMNENNPRLAIEYLTKAVQLNQKDEEAISLLGVAHGVLGEYDQAIEIFNSVLSINPKSADSYFNLYLTYSNKGDKIKADECLNKAKNIDPSIMDKFNKISH